MSVSEPLMTYRNVLEMMSKSEEAPTSGISLAITYVLAKRHPVWRRHDRVSGFCSERENLSLRCEGRTLSERTSQGEEYRCAAQGRSGLY